MAERKWKVGQGRHGGKEVEGRPRKTQTVVQLIAAADRPVSTGSVSTAVSAAKAEIAARSYDTTVYWLQWLLAVCSRFG